MRRRCLSVLPDVTALSIRFKPKNDCLGRSSSLVEVGGPSSLRLGSVGCWLRRDPADLLSMCVFVLASHCFLQPLFLCLYKSSSTFEAFATKTWKYSLQIHPFRKAKNNFQTEKRSSSTQTNTNTSLRFKQHRDRDTHRASHALFY